MKEEKKALAAGISEQQTAEEELRISEERWRYALDVSKLGAWELNLIDHTAWRSLRHDQIFGYAELLPEWTYEIFLNKHVLEEDRAEVDRSFQGAVAEHRPWSFECRIRRTDGAVRWIWAYGKELGDVGGKPIRMFGLVEDITERKQAEIDRNALERQLAQRSRNLIEAAMDPLAIISMEGKLTDVNEATVRMTGVEREKLLGTDYSGYFTEPEKAREGFRQVFINGFVIDYPLVLRHKDGQLSDLLCNVSLYKDSQGNVLGVLAAARDVTGRNRAEEELRQSQNFLKTMLDNLPVAVFAKSEPDGKFVLCNKGFERLLGHSSEEALGKTDYDYWPREQADFFRKKDLETFVKGTAQETSEEPIDSPTLGRRMLRTLKMPIFDKNHKPEYLLGITEDITERKNSEEWLQMMRFSVDRAGDSIFWVNRDGQITYVNESACVSRGYTREEMLTMKIFELDPDYQRELWGQHFEALKKQGTVTLETKHRRKDGSIFPIEVNANYISVGGKEFNFATTRDLTERRRAEGERARMAAIVDTAADAIIGNDLYGFILTWNPGAERIFGYTHADAVGQHISIIIPPDLVGEELRLFRRIQGGEKIEAYNAFRRRKDNTQVEVMLTVSPVKDAQGNVVEISRTAREILQPKV